MFYSGSSDCRSAETGKSLKVKNARINVRRKGISGVVVAALLTIVGIAAVLMFWGVISGLIGGRRLQGTIDAAQIIVTETGARLAVTVSNTGSIDFRISSIKLDESSVDTSQCTPNPANQLVSSGGALSIVCRVTAEAGKTYILTLEIEGSGRKSALTESVYARRG